MLRKLSFVTIIAVFAMLSCQVAFAQTGFGTTQNVDATANVYMALTTSATPVVFGNIALGAFKPVINPTGGPLTTAHVGAGASLGGITVNGSNGATITVSWAGQGVLGDGAAHTMKFTPSVTTSSAAYSSGANVTLTGGSRLFVVGGTLFASDGTSDVTTSQVAGAYSTAATNGTPVTFTIDYVL